MTDLVSSEAILADHEGSGFKARLLALISKLSPRAYFRRHKRKVILRTLLSVFLLVFLGPPFSRPRSSRPCWSNLAAPLRRDGLRWRPPRRRPHRCAF